MSQRVAVLMVWSRNGRRRHVLKNSGQYLGAFSERLIYLYRLRARAITGDRRNSGSNRLNVKSAGSGSSYTCTTYEQQLVPNKQQRQLESIML